MPARADNPADSTAVVVTQAKIDRAVASLDAIVKDIQHRSGVPGIAVAVVHNGRVVYAKGFGLRRIGTNERVDANTVFELASVSKSLASTVVAGAVGRGRVKWTDPIAKYIPGFTLADPWVGSHVTIEDMFAHRSGLPDHAGDVLEDLGYTRMQILAKLALLPLEPFRITYAYTNFGLTAGAEAAARAEGTNWETLSQNILYGPLGMTSTSSRWADYNKRADRATLHVRVGNRWKVSSRDADAQSPAGGASSSVNDLSKWLILELAYGAYNGEQVIDKDALLQTQLPQIMSGRPPDPTGRASFYGLGMNVGYDEAGRLRLSHSGAFLMGAGTAFEMLPSEHLGIVILTNGTPSGVPESIAKSFYNIVEFGKIQRDWYVAYSPVFAQMLADRGELVGKIAPARPTPALPGAAYAGTYANNYFGPASVRSANGRLTLTLGPRHETYELKHWNANTFSFTPAGESGTGISAVTFAPAAGTAATMLVEYLNENHLGTFTKG
jgi:CubicO group peptidase (beta-lactamase class C family)